MKKRLFFAAAFAAALWAHADAIVESPRELPLERDVDVLVLGGGSAAISAAEAEKIDAKCWIGLTRTVSLAAEALADPKLAPALEAALRRPGVMGHAAKSVDELAPGGGYKILPEVREGLCELNLARALLACGDPNGLARSVFDAYAEDPRGIWALHARRVMERRGR